MRSPCRRCGGFCRPSLPGKTDRRRWTPSPSATQNCVMMSDAKRSRAGDLQRVGFSLRQSRRVRGLERPRSAEGEIAAPDTSSTSTTLCSQVAVCGQSQLRWPCVGRMVRPPTFLQVACQKGGRQRFTRKMSGGWSPSSPTRYAETLFHRSRCCQCVSRRAGSSTWPI